MKITEIFQTLEDRGNKTEIESHGPYFCSLKDANGNLKKGVKEPWLGEGFYFWDSFIEDAKWWGNVIYVENGRGYVIGQTTYDQHSSSLYDTVADLDKMKELEDCAIKIKAERQISYVSFPLLLKYLKEKGAFPYKAIRVCPVPSDKVSPTPIAIFPGDKMVFSKVRRVQICFFDNSLFLSSFRIVFEQPQGSLLFTI